MLGGLDNQIDVFLRASLRAPLAPEAGARRFPWKLGSKSMVQSEGHGLWAKWHSGRSQSLRSRAAPTTASSSSLCSMASGQAVHPAQGSLALGQEHSQLATSVLPLLLHALGLSSSEWHPPAAQYFLWPPCLCLCIMPHVATSPWPVRPQTS